MLPQSLKFSFTYGSFGTPGMFTATLVSLRSLLQLRVGNCFEDEKRHIRSKYYYLGKKLQIHLLDVWEPGIPTGREGPAWAPAAPSNPREAQARRYLAQTVLCLKSGCLLGSELPAHWP